jgi:hypothetical protein
MIVVQPLHFQAQRSATAPSTSVTAAAATTTSEHGTRHASTKVHLGHSGGRAAGPRPEPLTRHQLIYTQETAKSAHLSASTAEQRSDATNRAGNLADEAQEDLPAIKMIRPSTQNRKDVL